MSTITVILEADSDGTLHLPVPDELRRGKVLVEARLEPAPDDGAETERQERLASIMKRIRARNPFKEIEDPVAWQREMRDDVKLPGRD